MKKLTMVLCAFALSIFACSAAFAADSNQKHTLKFQYPVGDYTMTMKTDNDMMMGFNGQEIPMKQTQKMTFAMTVTNEGSDGNKRVAMELKRFEMATESGGMKMSLDSDSEDDMKNPAMKALSAMLNTKLSTIYDKDYKIVKVEGADEMWDKMGKDNPMLAAMKESMGDNAFTQSIDQTVARFPKTPVAVGESWKSETENKVPMFGKMKTISENTLKSVDSVDSRQIATIETKEEFTAEGENTVNMGPLKFTYKNMKMKSDTVSKIDMESGLVNSTTGNMDMFADMETKSPMNPDEVMTMSINGKIKVEMNIVPEKK